METSIKKLEETNSSKISELKKQLVKKTKLINETDSKLEIIGIYVDKLEERLASFAIAKRDISKREEACQSFEEKASAAEVELEKMREEYNSIKEERDEMKKLVDLLPHTFHQENAQ